MKSNIKIISVLLLLAIIFTLGSCKKDVEPKITEGYIHVPADAFGVLVIDGAELLKFYNTKMIKDNPEVKEAIEGLKNESPKLAELLNTFLISPDASGILLSKKLYAFSAMDGKDLVFGVILPINKSVFDKNLDIIEEELNFKVSDMMNKKDDFLYIEPEKGMVIGWNNESIMIVINEASNSSKELFEKYMKLKRNESIISNSDFAEFHKECKAVNLWLSSNIIENTDIKDNADLKEFEELTGVKISGNYGHVHIDIQKDEITYISKLKFNESIQNLNIEKLINNADKLVAFFDNLSLDELNPFADRAKMSEEEMNLSWEEEYPGITKEEYDQMMKDLNNQNF